MKKLNLKKLSKKQITILITSLCVVVASVFAISYVVVESASDDKVIDKKSSSIKNKNKKDDTSDDKKDTDDKKAEVKVEEKIADVNTNVNDGTSGNTNTGNTNTGNANGNVAPTPPPPSKVCSASNVLFENLPCDTILTQYNVNGWGIGNSGMTFANSQEAWDYGNAKVREWGDAWANDTTGTVPYPQYTGFDGYTLQYNDGSVKWSVMFK